MKKTEKRKATREIEVLVELVCDLCGASRPGEGNESPHSTSADWERPSDKTKTYSDKPRDIEVTVRLVDRWTSPYPDGGGDEKRTEFDLCPECFARLAAWP